MNLQVTSAVLAEIVAEVFEVDPGSAIESRLRRLQLGGWPDPKVGRGRQAIYSLRSVLDTVMAFALVDAGLDVDSAAAACLAADGRSGKIARCMAASRGKRGELFTMEPLRLASFASQKSVDPVLGMPGLRLHGERAWISIEAGLLGERVTKSIVGLGIVEGAALEVDFAAL